MSPFIPSAHLSLAQILEPVGEPDAALIAQVVEALADLKDPLAVLASSSGSCISVCIRAPFFIVLVRRFFYFSFSPVIFAPLLLC